MGLSAKELAELRVSSFRERLAYCHRVFSDWDSVLDEAFPGNSDLSCDERGYLCETASIELIDALEKALLIIEDSGLLCEDVKNER